MKKGVLLLLLLFLQHNNVDDISTDGGCDKSTLVSDLA